MPQEQFAGAIEALNTEWNECIGYVNSKWTTPKERKHFKKKAGSITSAISALQLHGRMEEAFEEIRKNLSLGTKALETFSNENIKKLLQIYDECEHCHGTGRIDFGEGEDNCGHCAGTGASSEAQASCELVQNLLFTLRKALSDRESLLTQLTTARAEGLREAAEHIRNIVSEFYKPYVKDECIDSELRSVKAALEATEESILALIPVTEKSE